MSKIWIIYEDPVNEMKVHSTMRSERSDRKVPPSMDWWCWRIDDFVPFSAFVFICFIPSQVLMGSRCVVLLLRFVVGNGRYIYIFYLFLFLYYYYYQCYAILCYRYTTIKRFIFSNKKSPNLQLQSIRYIIGDLQSSTTSRLTSANNPLPDQLCTIPSPRTHIAAHS